VTQEELVASSTEFESDILFFKTDEHVVVQQHLVYYKNRPYFNLSLCMKNQDQTGFNLKEAALYDFDKHCRMLGSWIPVYTPDGVEVMPNLFAKAFEAELSKFMTSLERRQVLAPLVDSLKATLTDFDNLLLLTAGAAIVRQAYIIAPMANNFGNMTNPKNNMRMMKAGSFLMVLSLLGLFTEAYDRQTSVKVHQEKLQEVIFAVDQMDYELDALMSKDKSPVDAPVESRIFGAIVNALAVGLATVEMESSWICLPMVDPNDPLSLSKQII
jgi:hypothetical protein